MWISKGFDFDGNKIYVCSECGAETDREYPFCPYCGEKQKNDDE